MSYIVYLSICVYTINFCFGNNSYKSTGLLGYYFTHTPLLYYQYKTK